MPQCKTQTWSQGYVVKLTPSDFVRSFVNLFFHVDFLPYLYGADIKFNLQIWRANSKAPKDVRYEWRLCSPDEKHRYDAGKGFISTSVVAYRHFHLPKAIELNIGSLSVCTQYKLQMRLINVDRKTYKTIAEFTLKDRDDFYRDIVLKGLISLAIIIISGFIGYFIGIR